jgi:transposase InsO family protein
VVTVIDDFSRYILACEVQRDVTANWLVELVQHALDPTTMSEVPIKDRTLPLSDSGSGYVSRAFGNYLRVFGIKHIIA